MTILYQFLATALVVLHLGFVGFVGLGGILCLKWPRLVQVHIPAVLWGITVELTGWVCPLTPLENYFRLKAGDTTYSSDFILHYLTSILYPESLNRQLQWTLALVVFVMNAVIYTLLFRRKTRQNQ